MIASAPVVHRVGGVADLARLAAVLHHRFEHLGGHDHWDSPTPPPPRDLFLNSRHRLERRLETQVAASDHDGVARVKNLLDSAIASGRSRLLQRAGRHPTGVKRHALDVSPGTLWTKLIATKSTPVFHTECPSLPTSLGVRPQRRQRNPRRINAFVLPSIPPQTTVVPYLPSVATHGN